MMSWNEAIDRESRTTLSKPDDECKRKTLSLKPTALSLTGNC